MNIPPERGSKSNPDPPAVSDGPSPPVPPRFPSSQGVNLGSNAKNVPSETTHERNPPGRGRGGRQTRSRRQPLAQQSPAQQPPAQQVSDTAAFSAPPPAGRHSAGLNFTKPDTLKPLQRWLCAFAGNVLMEFISNSDTKAIDGILV